VIILLITNPTTFCYRALLPTKGCPSCHSC